MNDRQLKTSKLLSVIGILSIACTLYLISVRRQYIAQKARFDWQKRQDDWLSSKFVRVQRVRDKVLLIPALPPQASKDSIEFSILSKQEKGFWREPRLVSTGFMFGHSYGGHEDRYKVVKLQPDGVLVEHRRCCDPPDGEGVPRILKLRWK